ncbi:hypothetical protein Tco_1440750 [Tanacetum coccineum]
MPSTKTGIIGLEYQYANVTLSFLGHLLEKTPIMSVQTSGCGGSLGQYSYWVCRHLPLVAACASKGCREISKQLRKAYQSYGWCFGCDVHWEAFYQLRIKPTYDGGNTRDRVKKAGEVIGSGDEIEFSEELQEMLPWMKLGKNLLLNLLMRSMDHLEQRIAAYGFEKEVIVVKVRNEDTRDVFRIENEVWQGHISSLDGVGLLLFAARLEVAKKERPCASILGHEVFQAGG